MILKEEDCWIYEERPIKKKMEKKIRKLTDDPNDGVLECGVDFHKSDLRRSTPSEDIVLLTVVSPTGTSITSFSNKQYRNMKAILGKGNPTDSAYKGYRRGYEYSDTEEELAKQAQEKCREKVCAIVIRGEIKKQSQDVIKGYALGKPEKPTDSYELDYKEIDYNRRINIERNRDFSDLLDAEAFIASQKGKTLESFTHPTLRKVSRHIPVHMDWETETTTYDKVRYFQFT